MGSYICPAPHQSQNQNVIVMVIIVSGVAVAQFVDDDERVKAEQLEGKPKKPRVSQKHRNHAAHSMCRHCPMLCYLFACFFVNFISGFVCSKYLNSIATCRA